MDLGATITSIYAHVETGHVDRAVMACLRVARHLQDYLHAAIFLHEMNPDERETARTLCDDTRHLPRDAQKFLWEQSRKRWLDTHTLDFDLTLDDEGEKRNVLMIAVGEIDPELEQWERSIQDLALPSGMGAFDTAAFTDRYANRKAQTRLRMKALQTVKERVRARCLDYAITIERQLESQSKSLKFLARIENAVQNYFKAHSEDVYAKLQKATTLIDSEDPEDPSLLLTLVRRAIKAAADYSYPPASAPVMCSDGTERNLDDDHYLNRLEEYLRTAFPKSSSRELLQAEYGLLAVFARRLNDVASKGVHAEVSAQEAKQGLLGLYMFLYNIISHLPDAEVALKTDVSQVEQ